MTATDPDVAALSARLQSQLYNGDIAVWAELQSDLAELLSVAQSEGREQASNQTWFLKSVAEARSEMISAFNNIKAGQQKQGWDQLERVEIALLWLSKNPFLSLEEYRVGELSVMVERWQSLFPYKVFLSPEFIIKGEECSICDEVIGPWSTCEHEPGKVYRGELCHRRVKDMAMGGIAFVLDPVQKYSVAMASAPGEPDPMDYRMVNWVADRVTGPFAVWFRQDSTKLLPHSQFDGLTSSNPCPCRSERTYEVCCMKRDGVLIPHTDIIFTDPLPANLPTSTECLAPPS